MRCRRSAKSLIEFFPSLPSLFFTHTQQVPKMENNVANCSLGYGTIVPLWIAAAYLFYFQHPPMESRFLSFSIQIQLLGALLQMVDQYFYPKEDPTTSRGPQQSEMSRTLCNLKLSLWASQENELEVQTELKRQRGPISVISQSQNSSLLTVRFRFPSKQPWDQPSISTITSFLLIGLSVAESCLSEDSLKAKRVIYWLQKLSEILNMLNSTDFMVHWLYKRVSGRSQAARDSSSLQADSQTFISILNSDLFSRFLQKLQRIVKKIDWKLYALPWRFENPTLGV